MCFRFRFQGLLCRCPFLLRKHEYLQSQHDCENVGGIGVGEDRKHAAAGFWHVGSCSQFCRMLAHSEVVSGSQLAEDYMRNWRLDLSFRLHPAVLHDLRCIPEPVLLSWRASHTERASSHVSTRHHFPDQRACRRQCLGSCQANQFKLRE